MAGATGVLGRRLVGRLVANGHTVVGLARTPEKERLVKSLGGIPARADLFDAKSLASAMAGTEVAIRTATSIPTKTRLKPEDFHTNDRIRTQGTRAMIEAAARVGARGYVHESIVWAVRSSDGSPYGEEATPNPQSYLRATLEGERIARQTGEQLGMDVAILRCGLFYAPDAAHTRTMGERLMKGTLPIVGNGQTTGSLAHADDAAAAFVAASESQRGGLWHVVDNRPVTLEELFTEFARRLGARSPRRVPPWLAKLAAGSLSVEILLTSFPTSSIRFQRETGWRPKYPTFREGLDQIVGAWKSEGFPGLGR